MSLTYHLKCDQCRVYVWVGQATVQNPAGWYLYTGKDHVLKLQMFLREHQGHPLRFVDESMADTPEETEEVILKDGGLVVDLLDPPPPLDERH